MNNINIILTHINCNDPNLYCKPGLPDYIEDTFKQIRLFNKCYVYFLTNSANIINNDIFKKYDILPIAIEDFTDDRIDKFSGFFYENGFWNVTASRFFYIENFIRRVKLENVIHFENDILVYEDLSKYNFDIFKRLAITPGSPKECMTGMLYIKDSESIRSFNDYMLDIVSNNKIDALKSKYEIDYPANEMNILLFYSRELGSEYLDYFPILPFEHSYHFSNFNSIFDPATFGQFIGGTRLEETGAKPKIHYISQYLSKESIIFDYVDGYLKPFFLFNDKKILINNLHIHSKKLHLYVSRKKYNYIQGEKFIPFADNDKVIYSETHYVNTILRNPPKEDFILITHNGDAKVTDNIRIHSPGIEDADVKLMPNNLIRWYGQNINFKHEKIESLPIGLENYYNFPHLKKIEKLEKMSRTVKIENKLLYVNFNINTNLSERKPAYDYFQDKSYATVKLGVNGFNFDEYLKDLYEHKFVLCPEGNGTDTHRTWECLYLGTIPIEKRNINNQFYTDLPICFVDKWEDINEDFLNSEYKRIKSKRWNLEKLDMTYWFKKINKMEKYVESMIDEIDYENGFFIECGANDGITQSYTYALEKRNWSGILIEPSIEAFNKCMSNRSGKNIFVNCALSDQNKIIRGDFDGNLMSSVDGIRLGRNNFREIESRTLTSILEQYEITNIDLFSLDVEGYEFNILQGLDFDKYSPKYLLIEIYSKDYDNIVNFLSEKKYELIKSTTNYNKKDNPQWDETHNDYLFKKKS